MLYERVLSSIAERVSVASTDRGRSMGSPFSLLRQFEAYDDGYGSISGNVMENILGMFNTQQLWAASVEFGVLLLLRSVMACLI